MLSPWRTITVFLLILAIITAPLALIQSEEIFVASDIYSSGTPGESNDLEQVDILGLAKNSCEAGNVGTALRLATLAVCKDPNHADARRVLGYRRVGDHWVGSFAARQLERGEIWHKSYGWIMAADLPHYLAGKRPLGKRWITTDEDARRHATIEKGWRIRTDHFRVVTNHSREAAAELAAQLELLYQVWQQQFGGFFLKPADLLKRFDGQEASGYRRKPFDVVYYRTRQEYNSALRRQQPRIDMTLGIYFDKTRKTHFFAGDEQDPGTIYHEAVHQFFQESGRPARSVGALSNAWLIEGVACYFESLVDHEGSAPEKRSFTIGTPSAGRLPAARHRRLVDDFYVPLAELSALGMQDFQRRSDLPRLYSQAAGLVTFLMQYQQGIYRPALVEMLQHLYAGRDKVSTLEELTGQSFTDLDRQYRQYLESLPTTTTIAAP